MKLKGDFEKYVLLVMATFTIYTTIIAFSPHQLIYDEVYYVKVAQDFSISKFYEFIKNLPTATGILYSLIHYLFYPLTQYQLPNIRFINLFLLLVSSIIIFLSLRIIHKQKNNIAFLNSIPWLVFPTTGVISCLALTELPAITLFLASSFLLGIAYNQGNWRSQTASLLCLSSSGVLLGLSTWGRQNLIVALAGTVFIFLPIKRKSIIFSLTYIIPAVLISLYPVSIWQGLVPPSVASIAEGYRLSSFILSLGYLGIFSLIIFPKFLLTQDKRSFLFLLVLSLGLVLILPKLNYLPSKFLLERLLGNMITSLVSYLFTTLLFFLCFLLINAIYLQTKKIKRENNPNLAIYIYYSIALIVICLSNIKITHLFTSRYITLALPLLLYIVGSGDFLSKDKLVLYRFTFSLTLSIIFILNYYNFLPF